MIAVAAAALVAVAIALPHALRLERAPPGVAGAIWLSALLLRALASVAVVVVAEAYLPTLGAFEPLAALCVDAGGAILSGHAALDLALALPALALACSLVAVATGLVRAERRVRTLLRDGVVGPGPGESLVVADGAIAVAAAGLRRPRIVVSAGALLALDDAELRASLDHERGHIALRHRQLLVAGELARAIARFLPGTRAAARELVFSLERDADRYALRRAHDPAVLASAIGKAARDALGGGAAGAGPSALALGGRAAGLGAPALELGDGAVGAGPSALGLGGGGVARRMRLLLHGGAAGGGRAPVGLLALAPAMVVLVAAIAIALPFVAHAGFHERGAACAASYES